jgi:hypothetical protein
MNQPDFVNNIIQAINKSQITFPHYEKKVQTVHGQ